VIRRGESGNVSFENDGDPNGGPVRDPIDDPDLNKRQRWFLAAITEGRRVDARAIKSEFGVSEKTAKRDIAGLKARSLLQFVGTRRRGRYKPLLGASH
jgi:predicted HTH transcriptional regulator